MTTPKTSPTEQLDADLKRAEDALREAYKDIRSRDLGGALTHIKLAEMLVLVQASKQDRGGR
jgi:hypothetical protein